MEGVLGVILPAAGSGSRFVDSGGRGFKTEILLADRPIWYWSVRAFRCCSDVGPIVLVVPSERVDRFQEQFPQELQSLQVEVTAGGSCRAASVLNGLAVLRQRAEWVAVHDAARPLVQPDLILQTRQAAIRTGAALPALPVNSTVKRVGEDACVLETIPRDSLRLAQTPQISSRAVLADAFDKMHHRLAEITDEASLLEACGQAVECVPGDAANLKITRQSDLQLAEFYIQSGRVTLAADRG